MKLSAFGVGPTEYTLNLDYYHGKDIIHTGFLLELNPKKSWHTISHAARKQINKRDKIKGLKIVRVQGTAAEIKLFRSIWFDPTDNTIPSTLNPNEVMYLAYVEARLVGGIILTPVPGNSLFLHNLASNIEGKKLQIPSILLWHVVEQLKSSNYKYLDIGVSFRHNLYRFFKHWGTHSYPVIFTPPFIKPLMTLTPFNSKNIVQYNPSKASSASLKVSEYFSPAYTFFPRGIYALKALLKHYQLTSKDSVAIYKTLSENNFISRCVTETIDSCCSWERQITVKTKMVLVIHEFGFPYEGIEHLKTECDKRNIPLIEDCAWAYGSTDSSNQSIGSIGTHALYSLPKIWPTQSGAIVTNLTISDDKLWSDYQLLDYFKREVTLDHLSQLLAQTKVANNKRRRNWRYLNRLFRRDGFRSLIALNTGVYPAVYPLKLDNQDVMNTLFDRYANFGVETGRYYPENSLLLPVHQNVSPKELDYIYAIFRGYLNLCSDYRRK